MARLHHYNGKKLTRRLTEWLEGKLVVVNTRRAGLDSVAGKSFIDVHIDELLPEMRNASKKDLVTASLDAFAALMELPHVTDERFLPRLTLFLKESRTLKLEPPSLSSLPMNLHRSTPPCLYVLDREIMKIVWEQEMYEVPVFLKLPAPRTGILRSVYRTTRIFSKTRVDPTYDRYFEVEYVPKLWALA